MDYKRILTIQDISCVGQCSSTVALPILSAMGNETCVLPSALLSCHTAFENFTFRDLSGDFEEVLKVWIEEGITFDAIYTGYLGTEEQVEQVIKIIDTVLRPEGKVVVDPVMGDNGALYTGFNENYVDAVRELAKRADVILPNITEACLLAGFGYIEKLDEEKVETVFKALSEKGMRNVILTGVSFDPEKTGAAIMTDGGKADYYQHIKLPKSYPGTGDVFASTFTGKWVGGETLKAATSQAADFTAKCIEATLNDPTHWYGVKFEPMLRELIL